MLQVMEEKVRRLEKKVKEANDKLKTAQIEAAVSSSTPEAEGKGAENAIKKDGEISGLKKKLDDLQGKYDKLLKDTDEMRNPPGLKNRTPKVAKDFTPKATLIKWVNELEAECGKWH